MRGTKPDGRCMERALSLAGRRSDSDLRSSQVRRTMVGLQQDQTDAVVARIEDVQDAIMDGQAGEQASDGLPSPGRSHQKSPPRRSPPMSS